MIGFLKWLWSEYQRYKLEQIFKSTDESKNDLFMKNYQKCLEVGFSDQQLMALMNLLYKEQGE